MVRNSFHMNSSAWHFLPISFSETYCSCLPVVDYTNCKGKAACPGIAVWWIPYCSVLCRIVWSLMGERWCWRCLRRGRHKMKSLSGCRTVGNCTKSAAKHPQSCFLPHSLGQGEKIGRTKVRKIMGWDKDGLIREGRGKNRSKAKEIIQHPPQAGRCSFSLCAMATLEAQIPLLLSLSQILLLGMMIYRMEYSFGPFGQLYQTCPLTTFSPWAFFSPGWTCPLLVCQVLQALPCPCGPRLDLLQL